MVVISKLTPEEIQQITVRKDNIDYSPYLDALDSLPTDDNGQTGGVINLDPDERFEVIRRRMTSAARRRGIDLRYRKTGDRQLTFFVKKRRNNNSN